MSQLTPQGSSSQTLIFTESPRIEVASNIFEHVAVVLQFGDKPLIEIVKDEKAGYTTQISIYHSDGTYLAKVKGSQMYRTEEGAKAGVELKHPPLLTVCEMHGKTLFELRREHAAALKLSAELYSQTGAFIKTPKSLEPTALSQKSGIVVMFKQGGMLGLKDLYFSDGGENSIGIHFQSDGTLALATNCLVKQLWKGEPVMMPLDPTVWVRMERAEGNEELPGVSNMKIQYHALPPGRPPT